MIREERLKLIDMENHPRHVTLRWYLDIVGMDHENKIKIITNIPKLNYMSNRKNITIREIQDSDIEKVVTFHNEYYEENRTSEQWIWEYKNAYPDHFVFIIAENTKNLIATQGMIPIYLNINGKRYLSGKSENSLVDNIYKGLLFLKIYKIAISKCQEKEMNCIWGYTHRTQIWERGLKFKTDNNIMYQSVYIHNIFKAIPEIINQKWKMIKKSGAFILIFAIYLYSIIFKLYNIFHVYSGKSKFIIENQLRSIKDLEMLYERLRTKYPDLIHISQDEKYLNWRIYNHPILKYKASFLYENDLLRGYCYFHKNRENTVFISDLTYENDEAGKYLIKKILVDCSKNKVGIIYFFGNYKNKLMAKTFNLLKKHGFIKRKRGVALVIKNILYKEKNGLYNTERWYANGLWSEGYIM